MDPNAKNFGSALSQNLEKTGQLCLGQTTWSLYLGETDFSMAKSIPTARAGKILKVEAAGLVRGTETQIELSGHFL